MFATKIYYIHTHRGDKKWYWRSWWVGPKCLTIHQNCIYFKTIGNNFLDYIQYVVYGLHRLPPKSEMKIQIMNRVPQSYAEITFNPQFSILFEGKINNSNLFWFFSHSSSWSLITIFFFSKEKIDTSSPTFGFLGSNLCYAIHEN